MDDAHNGIAMIAERDGVEELFQAFQVLGSLQRSFESTETKHRLRRVGFEPKPFELCSPFRPNAFFGDVVLSSAWLSDETAGEARCVFYSGVVVHMLSDSVAPRLPGRPEMQAGIVFTGNAETWVDEDDRELEALQAQLGPAWQVERRTAGGRRKSLCLAAREDALRIIEQLGYNRIGLLRARDDFFKIRWADLADASEQAYEWLRRRV